MENYEIAILWHNFYSEALFDINSMTLTMISFVLQRCFKKWLRTQPRNVIKLPKTQSMNPELKPKKTLIPPLPSMKKPNTAMNNEGCEIWSALQASGKGWILEAAGQWTAKPDY